MNTLFSDQIKQATLSNHQELEKILVTKIRSIDKPAKYLHLLQLFYGYYGGLEELITAFLGDNELDYSERRKTESINADITCLKGDLPAKADMADLPRIDDELKAMGALYVMEGSTLGGQIITKMITRQLSLEDNDCLKFFSGYGADTEAMWAAFKQVLNKLVQNDADAATVIQAANETFLKFKDWIQSNSSSN